MKDTRTYREKKIDARKELKDILGNTVNPDIIDGLECYILGDIADFCRASDVKSKGLANDLETLPITVLTFNLSSKEITYETNGKEYLGIK